MKQLQNTTWESKPYQKKLKHAADVKFNLRKAVYEMNRLSFDKGTRSGDYLIREKILAINEELDLYDSKIKTCEFTLGNSPLYQEILLFFEERYLDNFDLGEKIDLLKQTLADQKKADIEHNISHKDEKYKRSDTNIFRDELEKDLRIFESTLIHTVFPNLKEFLTETNNLLFYNEIKKIIEINSSGNFSDAHDMNYKILKKDINFFIKINSKIQKKRFHEKEAVAVIYSLLNEMEINAILLNHFKINEEKFSRIIIDSAREFCKYQDQSESYNTGGTKQLNEQTALDGTGNRVATALKNLQYLTGIINMKTNINILPGDLPKKGIKKYLFDSPQYGKILLKNIADYLKDSLFFLNEWLSTELKKNQNSYNHLKLLTDCLPAEIVFYELYETAAYLSSQETYQKINMWGNLQQYIPSDIADNIIHSIELICRELKDAFIKSTIDIEFSKKSAENMKLAKKINIVYDFFDKAREKIIKEIHNLR